MLSEKQTRRLQEIDDSIAGFAGERVDPQILGRGRFPAPLYNTVDFCPACSGPIDDHWTISVASELTTSLKCDQRLFKLEREADIEESIQKMSYKGLVDYIYWLSKLEEDHPALAELIAYGIDIASLKKIEPPK